MVQPVHTCLVDRLSISSSCCKWLLTSGRRVRWWRNLRDLQWYKRVWYEKKVIWSGLVMEDRRRGSEAEIWFLHRTTCLQSAIKVKWVSEDRRVPAIRQSCGLTTHERRNLSAGVGVSRFVQDGHMEQQDGAQLLWDKGSGERRGRRRRRRGGRGRGRELHL